MPPHEPAEQASGVVQALLSLQDAVLFACAQPVGFTHESFVQGLPSSQLRVVPAWQVWPEHVSVPLQGLPSAQSASTLQQPATALWEHVLLEQTSVVQTFPSSQSEFTVQLNVVKLQIGLVAVDEPSLTSTYHS